MLPLRTGASRPGTENLMRVSKPVMERRTVKPRMAGGMMPLLPAVMVKQPRVEVMETPTAVVAMAADTMRKSLTC